MYFLNDAWSDVKFEEYVYYERNKNFATISYQAPFRLAAATEIITK